MAPGDNVCTVCEGTGKEWFWDKDGNPDKDICSNCWGKGYFDEEDLKEAG